MTNEARILTNICTDFLQERLSAEHFVKKFQEYFEENQEHLNGQFDNFDEIYMACEYYQPEPEVRAVNNKLIDEKRLRQIVSQEIKKMKVS